MAPQYEATKWQKQEATVPTKQTTVGTVNNDKLYKGKYRDEVYEEDEEEQEAQSDEAIPEEATAQQQGETETAS